MKNRLQLIPFFLFLILFYFQSDLRAQQPGNALKFDGTNDYVSLPNALTTNVTLSTNNAITIEYWFKGTYYLSAVNFNNSNGYIISGRGGQHIISTDGGITNGLTIPTSVYDGRWHHIAMTWQKNVVNGFKSYVDGIIVAQRNSANVNLPTITTGGYLGTYNTGSDFINGSLDEVRIYNIALTQSNILYDMVNANSVSQPNLLAHYHFNQGNAGLSNSGIVSLRDTSGKGYHGNLVNFSLSGTLSNWIESYAMVKPVSNAASNITANGFTANWSNVNLGTVNNFVLEVATNSDFTGQIVGSPFTHSASTFNHQVSNLNPGKYYYRISANKTSVSNQGTFSNIITVNIPYQTPGNCLAFDGNNDYVNLPIGIVNGLTNNYTVEAWLLYNGGNNWQRLFDFGSGTSKYMLFTPKSNMSGSLPFFEIYNGQSSQKLIGNKAFVTGKWYHIAITYQNNNNTGKLYINGELIDENNSITITPGSLGATTHNYLGKSQYNDPYLNGKIDEFRIWNTTRSQTEIVNNMNGMVASNATGLVNYYSFDEGVAGFNNQSVNTLLDKTTNNLNGTLTNFALNGNSSNWVESYATVIAQPSNASNITPTGFNINWVGSPNGIINNYLVDVSEYNDFSTVISGSPFSTGGTVFTVPISGLKSNSNYYYRVRANNALMANQGAISVTKNVRTLSNLVPPGNCLSFDGTSDYITIPSSTGINNQFENNRITLAGWYYFKSLPTNTSPMLIGESFLGDHNIKFCIKLNNTLLEAGFYNNTWSVANCAVSELKINRWMHIAATYDKTKIKLYVDGVLVGTYNTTANLPNGTEEWRIGRRWDNADYANCNIDEIRIYNEALSANQIEACMKDTAQILPNNLVAYFNFDQGIASGNNSTIGILTDVSKNAHYNGILQTFANSGSSSNWISSYAMVVPTSLNATSVTGSSFIANWNAPIKGTFNNYYLDVATTSDFSAPISGSPFVLGNSTLSHLVNGLITGTYYYRVRTNNNSYAGQGSYSKTVSVLIPYTPPGNALSFDGSNDYISTVIDVSETAYTSEMWFKTTNGNCGIFSVVNNSASSHDRHIYLSAGNIKVRTWENEVIATSGTNYADGKWHHVAHVLGVGGQKIYVDGLLKASGSKTSSKATNQTRVWIGRSFDASSDYFSGELDEVRIWNAVRTQAQIQANMKVEVPANTSDLILYYHFDQGVIGSNNTTANIARDLTNYNHDGNLLNFSLVGGSSNWVESYAMVIASATNATNITSNSFIANWTAPLLGVVSNYYLDVSTTADFSGPIMGSPFLLANNVFTKTLYNLSGGTYYYRVRANKTSVANSGGYSNTVTVIIPYTAPGNGLAFDGVNDYLKSENNTVGNFGTSNFTVEYWIKTTDSKGYHLAKRANGCHGGSFWSMYHGLNNNPNQLYLEINHGSSYQILLSPILQKPINDNKWHHMAIVREGAKATIYVDGEYISSATSNGVANISNNGNLYVGSSPCSTYLNGSIDEIRLWNIARSKDSIVSGMSRVISPNTTGLVSYYNFDQGVAGAINYGRNILYDKVTSSNNHLDLINFGLEALNTNWVESYATVVPTLLEPTNVNPHGFTLNWTAPAQGVVTNYIVDVSLSPNFTAPISGSPFNTTGLSLILTGLESSTFYCRVRANNTGSVVNYEGGPSNVKVVKIEFVQPGNAIKFDGIDDYATIARNISGDFTLEYWVKTTQTGPTVTHFYQARGIVDNEGSSSADFGTALIGSKLAFGVGETTILSNTSINTGKWFHVAVTRKQSTGQIRLYINGNLEINATSNTANLTSSANIRLGANNGFPGNSNYAFNGAIDELRIWNVERSLSEIAQNFYDTVARNSAGLVDYYRFDQGIGGGNNTGLASLIDIAGANNGGTLSNLSLSGLNSNWINSYDINVNAPINLSVSNNICSKIDLNWQLGSGPTNNCDASVYCDASNFKQYVYADDNLLAIFPYNTSSCSFNVNQYYNNHKLIRGQDYYFKVVTVYLPPLFKLEKHSNPSNTVSGKFKANPSVPAGFTASTFKCDGSIDLNWTWTEVNPQNGFIINRSLDSTMSAPTIFTLNGNTRSYVNNGLQRGQNYFYQIFARNDCYNPAAIDSMFAGESDSIIPVAGISPQVPNRPSNVRLFADSTVNLIYVRWNDNSNNEDKFSIDRAAIGGFNTSFDVNANDTFFVDELASGCVTYNYTIKAYSGCALNGVASIGLNQTRLTPNLTNTFDDTTIYKLKCSKGYYSDRVELNWNSRNNSQLSNFRIYRKIANTNNDSILIASVLSGTGLYIDNTTVAGVLYRYYVVGELQCAGVTRYSNLTTDIGFRSPSGVINGTINYAGGFAASGVRVLAQNTTASKGSAIIFDGVDDYMVIPHKNNQITNNALTIEAWFKPQVKSNFVLAHKLDENGGYFLSYDSLLNQIRFLVANTTDSQVVSVANPFVSFGSFNQITATYALDSIKIFVNGMIKISAPNTIGSIGNAVTNILVGGLPNLNLYGKGIIDEFRIYKSAKSNLQIVNDYNRTVEINDPNLVVYFSFDDRLVGLHETYDQSNHNLVYNENHGIFFNGVQFTDSIPTSNELALAAYTNANGNYTITNIRYMGSGQNYNIVPTLGIHSYSPNNRVVFIGDGAISLNNIDFTDNSSFNFNGVVKYAGTNCPATGATVMIDDQFAIHNGQIVYVNDSGKFNIRVPVGNHVISLVQNKHEFSQGRFPPKGMYNFNEPLNATFIDSTFLKVVGRVVGGNVELQKVAGLGRSINNIGQAQFTFNSDGQSGLNGCFSKNVVTIDTTGEYVTYLLPLRYKIDNLKLVNNSDPNLLTNPSFNNPNVLDLSTIPDLVEIYDTLVTTAYRRIDSVKYHTRLDFSFFETPTIYLTNLNTPYDSLINNFIGEKSIEIKDTINVNIENNALGYPLFIQGKEYNAIVKVIEKYTNIDKPLNDLSRYNLVPVSGLLRINNNLTAFDSLTEIQIDKGVYLYRFKGGMPNQLVNVINPQYNYTKTLQLDFVPEIGNTINFLPNQSDLVNQSYRAYLFGSRPGGNNFTTKGPALVDFVLRDPPGSASSSTWSKGTAYSVAESFSFEESFSRDANTEIDLGGKLITWVGIGAGTITESESINNLSLGVSMGLTKSAENEIVVTTTSNITLSTGSDPGSVGADADIYYGKSSNIIFGNADVVELIDTGTCRILEANLGSSICFGNIVNGHQIGRKSGFYVAPGGIATTFAYTQDEIVNLIIPDLQKLRNQLLTNNVLNNKGQKKYTTVFNNVSDPLYARKFGSNNDDPIWGGLRSTPTPFARELKDTIGQSYIFRGNSLTEADSIRIFNDQIRLWKVAIARNEEAKFKAFNSSGTQPVNGGNNISIGKASLTQDFTTEVDETYTESFELNFGEEIARTIGFEVFDIGVTRSSTISFEQTKGKSKSTTKSISNTFSYTLQDGDDGDLISVDIVDPKAGGSHMFKLRAGRTSCPYEGAVNSMYYSPDNDTITASTELDDGFEIQPATAQNDVPVLSIDKNALYNIPANEEAVFILSLGNLSEGGQDRTYSLRVNQSTNPYGAIIKIDGLDPNRDFDVPYGTSIQKTLTIKRGPLHYDYNNIQLILKSACDDDIYDTLSVNAKFIPTCTSIVMKSPDDRWILNNNFSDTLPVLLGGYNYNTTGFVAVQLQYRHGGSNTWYTEKEFFKDTSNLEIKIPVGSPNISYPFSFKNLTDGNYELRASTECKIPGYPNTKVYSNIMQGIVDRVNPTPFGTPSPGTGILHPNDDISIQFNEQIEQSAISLSNFEVKGVLNKSDVRSNVSVYFDGDNDFIEVPQGFNLNLRPFTIEFWHKRGGLGHQVIFSQGADINNAIEIGFDANNKFYFELDDEFVTANVTSLDTINYNFYVVSYNHITQTVELFINDLMVNSGNNKVYNLYDGNGKLFIGKASIGTPKFTKGNIFEFRIWDEPHTLSQSNQYKSQQLHGTESHLLANWRMDEAIGTEVKDYARFRHGTLVNAQWFLSPTGKSYQFNGNGDFITIPTNHFGINKDMDFTIEFWFKGNNGNRVGLLSNGKGLLTDVNANLKWSIETDSIGRIVVKHKGNIFTATNLNYFDGNWHHLALVLKRNSSLTCYVDANLQNSVQSSNFDQWGGAKLWLGATGWNNNGNSQYDSTSNYFNGYIDDLRFWNSSRLLDQIKRDKNNRKLGNEVGLVVCVPFEDYQDIMGVPVLSATNKDIASSNRTFSSYGNAQFSSESPIIKLPRPTQYINFSYGVNGDKIIITPTIANELIENVTLDITVKDIQDKHGNKMMSPKTWIAYVDKNQVKWQESEKTFTKIAGAPLTFQATIVNFGGALKEFTINNLPNWLSASVTNSTINPNSTKVITFTVDPTVNIGKYDEDITLLTDFGFAERLIIHLNVHAVPPNWKVNIGDYSKSMNIVGQIRVNDVISSNADDLLGAFVNNVCRGVAKVQYYHQLDRYLVFLDVYGNIDNEILEFRIYNSFTGKTHVEVVPSITYVSNSVIGTVAQPQIFNALDKVNQVIPLQKGWNWISFNLMMTDSNNLNNLFNGLKKQNGNLIKNNTHLAVYDTINGWTGNLANLNTGVKPESSYLFFVNQVDTLDIRGVEANPRIRTINLNQGWNYLGFLSQRNISLNESFSELYASQNDLVKGHSNFAIYDSTIGWVGSLSVLKPHEGYLYKSAKNTSFNYPRSAMYGKKAPEDNSYSAKLWHVNPYKYQSNMNLICKVDACNNLPNKDELLIGAFVNDELRGYAKALKGQQSTYFLTVAGEKSENITFKLLDDNTGSSYSLDQKITYSTNQLIGNIKQPFLFYAQSPCVESESKFNSFIKVYPIPAKDQLLVDVNLKQDDFISIKIVDVSGRELTSINKRAYKKGLNQIELQLQQLPAGIYFLEVKTNDEVLSKKIIKQ